LAAGVVVLELDEDEDEDETPAAAPPELLAGEVPDLALVFGAVGFGVCVAGLGAVVVGVPLPPQALSRVAQATSAVASSLE
jgi:hypothetical protein